MNEVICHGIPDSRALQEGDIVNVDVTVYLDVSRRKGVLALGAFFAKECNRGVPRDGWPALPAPPSQALRLPTQGFHGDTSMMFRVGQVSAEAEAVCRAAEDALEAGVGVCGPGVPFRAIGDAVQRLADERGLRVVRGFCGHGVGRVFHSYPMIFHHRHARCFG